MRIVQCVDQTGCHHGRCDITASLNYTIGTAVKAGEVGIDEGKTHKQTHQHDGDGQVMAIVEVKLGQAKEEDDAKPYSQQTS